MTLPAIGALRERWPDGRLEILGYPRTIELARGRHYADDARSIDAKPMAGFFIPNAVLDPGLMEYFGSFNLVVSYLFDPDSIFANNVRRCGVRQVIEASPRPNDLPAAQHYCKPLEALAIYVDAPEPRLYPNEADRDAASRFLHNAGREPIVAVHPGSGSEKKNWPETKWRELIQRVLATTDWNLLLVGGEAEGERLRRLAASLPPTRYALAQSLPLVELAECLQSGPAFVGHDSGITHLAAALGLPCIVLWSDALEEIWRPQGERLVILKEIAGIRGISVERVMKELPALMRK